MVVGARIARGTSRPYLVRVFLSYPIYGLTRTFRTDDKMLMVWDLHPPTPARGAQQDEGDDNMNDDDDDDDESRPQPTAYVIPFPHPLTSISSHPHTSKEFLVSDCRGSVYLTDWRSDPVDIEEGNLRHSNLVELVEPYALSASCMGHPVKWSGSTAWRSDSVDM